MYRRPSLHVPKTTPICANAYYCIIAWRKFRTSHHYGMCLGTFSGLLFILLKMCLGCTCSDVAYDEGSLVILFRFTPIRRVFRGGWLVSGCSLISRDHRGLARLMVLRVFRVSGCFRFVLENMNTFLHSFGADRLRRRCWLGSIGRFPRLTRLISGECQVPRFGSLSGLFDAWFFA
jgi:hypothetical protein